MGMLVAYIAVLEEEVRNWARPTVAQDRKKSKKWDSKQKRDPWRIDKVVWIWKGDIEVLPTLLQPVHSIEMTDDKHKPAYT